MKRLLLLLIVCLTTFICHAQEHLSFMGIPIDGKLEEYTSKLINEKGFVSAPKEDGEEYMNMTSLKLIGTFEGISNCKVFTRKHYLLNNVSSVIVELNERNSNNRTIKKLIDKYDKIYGKHIFDNSFIDTYEWNVPMGKISINTYKDIVAANIIFSDYTEIAVMPTKEEIKKSSEEFRKQFYNTLKDNETIKEICGIQFGTSYEKCREMLENKYGYPDFHTDITSISYKNKTYAGITFDNIHFLFQSDGINSYFNGCVFIMDANSLNEAKKKQKLLYDKLSEKYFIFSDSDENGNKLYYGGISPVDDNIGFIIDIIKYDSNLSRTFVPYGARLAYGRYNYVKEEF